MSKLKRRPRGSERGQTFPIWISSIIAALVLLWFTLDYASTIRWQVRAQNAADAAAASLLSVQTTRWNQMEMTLYSLSLDEWRIRNLIESMTQTINGGGGCQTQSPAWVAGQTNANSACAVAYGKLRSAYLTALTRYTNEAQILQTIQQYDTLADDTTEINAIISAQNNGSLCGATNGWDCSFTYTLAPTPTLQTRSQVWNIYEYFNGGAFVAYQAGTQALINSNFLPARLEIVACAKVTPPIGNFAQLHAQPFTAIGRAGATTVGAVEEWIQPGSYSFPANDPKYPNQVIQPTETYGITYANAYATVFTGNLYSAIGNAYAGGLSVQEFSAELPWWTPLPFPPSGAYTPPASTCKAVNG
jgi:hypothetical protein